VVVAVEVAGAAALALLMGAAAGSVEAVWASAAIGFAVATEGYAAVVFARLTGVSSTTSRAPAATRLLAFLPPRPRPVLIALALTSAIGAALPIMVGLAAAAMTGLLAAVGRRLLLLYRLERGQAPGERRAPLHGRDRWKRLGDGVAAARDDAFWGLCVARPLARVALHGLAEARWLTPNRITVASIVACLSAAGVAAAAGGGALGAVAIALIFARSVLDSMDGQLARYQATSSRFGSYLDKVSDLFCWAALYAVLALEGHHALEHRWALVLPLVSVILLAFQGVTFWLFRSGGASGASLTAAGWAANLWRIVLFEEPDFYLWISLALATGRYDLFIPLIAAAHVARCALLSFRRAGIAWRSARGHAAPEVSR
jgi:phosphatidylglycerophosphate synthase